MSAMVRINEDNYLHLKQMAASERRSVAAQLGIILDERFGSRVVSQIQGTPKIIETSKVAEQQIVETVYMRAGGSTPEDKIDDLFAEKKSEAAPSRDMGDVLAEIRSQEAERDEELRYNQDPESHKQAADAWNQQIQLLWDEYNELKD